MVVQCPNDLFIQAFKHRLKGALCAHCAIPTTKRDFIFHKIIRIEDIWQLADVNSWEFIMCVH